MDPPGTESKVPARQPPAVIPSLAEQRRQLAEDLAWLILHRLRRHSSSSSNSSSPDLAGPREA
jgi:hypothetical protein